MKNKMVIVGVASPQYSGTEYLRLYYLEKRVVKDVKDEDLAPHVEKLGIMNFNDLQIPEVRALYPHYRTGQSNRYVSGQDACYVLGTFGDGGYVCIRPHLANDFIQVIPRSRLVSDVKRGKLYLLNAVIEQGNVSDTISPIAGEWTDMSHLKGRSLVDADDTSCDCGDEACSCGTTVDARDKIGAGETVDSHDELGMLGAEQKDFLKNYYIDYSIETFNKLVGKSQWRLKQDHEIVEKNKKRRETKLAKLAELRTLSNGANWRFAGLWDVGYVTGRPEHMCEFGHKLRYIYMACPVDKGFAEARDEGTLLRFGIKCHADFLSIPAEEVARLGKLLSTMSSEIAFISTVVANRALSKHDDLMASMHELLGRLQTNNKLNTVIGDRLASAYTGFKSNGLPLVESFVLDVLTRFKDYGTSKVLSDAGVDTSMFAPKPTDTYELPELEADASKWTKQNYPSTLNYSHNSGVNRLNRAHEPYPTVLASYADLLLTNDIAGEYMYNPNSTLTDFVKGKSTSYQRYGADEVVPSYPDAMRKFKIGYNSDTRELRTAWLRYFLQNTYREDFITAISGAPIRVLTLNGLEETIALYKRLTTAGTNIKNALGESAVRTLILDMVGVRLYRTEDNKYTDVHPALLLTTLPYIAVDASNVPARRAASYMLGKDAHKVLSASLDATKEGTDPEFLELLKSKIEPEPEAVEVEKPVEEVPEKPVTTPVAKPQVQEQVKTEPQPAPKAQTSKKQAAKEQTSKTSSYRGDATEAKKMADEFTTLYDELPKVLTADTTIQIAVDIIKRFRDTFKEKEGFTSREKWRVNKEIESLKRLKAQKNK